MRSFDPIVVDVPFKLKEYLTFEATLRTMVWIDDATAVSVVGVEDLILNTTLYNE